MLTLPLLLALFQPAAAPEPGDAAKAAAKVRWVIGHRGSCADRPENTLQSYRRAIEVGVPIAETDARTTKDGALVCLHDPDLARTTDGKGKVGDLTLAEIKSFDAGIKVAPEFKGTRVPELREVLALCKGRIDVMIDLKEYDEPYAVKVAEAVRKFGDPKQTVLGVRSLDHVRQFQKLLPESRQIGLVPTVNDIEPFAKAGVKTIRLWPKWLSDEMLVPRVRKLGLMLHIGADKGTKEEVLPLLSHQPESMSSDDPERLMQTLADLRGKGKRYFPPDPEMPAYTLPDPLTANDGSKVTTAEQWSQKRRGEVLELFRKNVYGRVPDTKYDLTFKVVKEDPKALDGAATLKLVEAVITRDGKSLTIPFSVFIPNVANAPSPAFLLICNREIENIDFTRKVKSPFWPVEEGNARGYAMVAFHNSAVDPDKHDGFKVGIHGLLETDRKPDSWGTLAAWAWGASRVMDYLVTDPRIDKTKVAVIGHSRGGKTALWAGAEDTRFALAVSNDSGCGGAAISRRKFTGKEQVARINQAFPHWFCDSFKQYGENEEKLPIDQHELLALIAPRAVAVGSALQDRWADPRGEFLSAVEASKVYALFGKKGLGTNEMPAIGEPLHGDGIHYHIRAGKHDLTLQDWQAYWDFADKAFRRTGK